MRPTLFAEDTEINGEECNRLVAGSPAVNPDIGGAGIDGPPSSSANESTPQPSSGARQGPPEPVTSFIRRTWAEGIPYNTAKLYADDDVPFLAKILDDPLEAKLWPSVVGTLGAIGSDRARYVLLNFLLRNPDGQLSSTEYLGKSNVPVALGWMVQRRKELSKEPDREALQTLIKMTDADWWIDTAKVNWTTPIHKSRQDLIASLVVKSMIGLALTGTDEARVRLMQVAKSAQGTPSAPSDFEAAVVLRNLGASTLESVAKVSPATEEAVRSGGGNAFVTEMLRENAEVGARGLESYYQK
jgi:hypothetical protein